MFVIKQMLVSDVTKTCGPRLASLRDAPIATTVRQVSLSQAKPYLLPAQRKVPALIPPPASPRNCKEVAEVLYNTSGSSLAPYRRRLFVR